MKEPFISPMLLVTTNNLNIDAIEDHYGSQYIGDFCLKSKNGGWTDQLFAIFYQPNPNFELGHTHYFGITTTDNGQILITNGESAFSEGIDAKIGRAHV